MGDVLGEVRAKRAVAAAMVAAWMTVGCQQQPPDTPPPIAPAERPRATKQVETGFARALALVSESDQRGGWTAERCAKVIEAFAGAEKKLKQLSDPRAPAARYNQAIALQRCNQPKRARTIFRQLLKSDPSHHHARVQIALYRLADAGEGGVPKAIAELERAIVDAKFQNAEALTYLAMMQMRRGDGERDADGLDDFGRAKLNLQRALAIDDAFMPAYNQLAIYYLESAKRSAGRNRVQLVTAAQRESRLDSAALELASLVCAQAIAKAPRYAAIHNTAGLVSVELGDLSAAARSFERARRLDARFFEAHMNYAAVNLQFRGFSNAQRAYQAALQLHPGDYDARLGLALALRGQIPKGDADRLLAASSKQLEAAKRARAERPEAYFNEAILVQEFRATGGKKAKPMLNKAKSLFGVFITKANGKPGYAAAVKRANERIADIDQILVFLGTQP